MADPDPHFYRNSINRSKPMSISLFRLLLIALFLFLSINRSKPMSISLFRLLLIALFLFLSPFFPSEPPQFISNTIFAKSWELIHLLLVGVGVSYGLFCRRKRPERHRETYPEARNSQAYHASMFHNSSIFEYENPFGLDTRNGTSQAWNLHYYRAEPMGAVGGQSCNFGELPLRLPVRSLRSQVDDIESDGECVSECGSESSLSNSDSTRSGKMGNSNNVDENFKRYFGDSFPVSWRSRSMREDFNGEMGNYEPNKLGSRSFRSPVMHFHGEMGYVPVSRENNEPNELGSWSFRSPIREDSKGEMGNVPASRENNEPNELGAQSFRSPMMHFHGEMGDVPVSRENNDPNELETWSFRSPIRAGFHGEMHYVPVPRENYVPDELGSRSIRSPIRADFHGEMSNVPVSGENYEPKELSSQPFRSPMAIPKKSNFGFSPCSAAPESESPTMETGNSWRKGDLHVLASANPRPQATQGDNLDNVPPSGNKFEPRMLKTRQKALSSPSSDFVPKLAAMEMANSRGKGLLHVPCSTSMQSKTDQDKMKSSKVESCDDIIRNRSKFGKDTPSSMPATMDDDTSISTSPKKGTGDSGSSSRKSSASSSMPTPENDFAKSVKSSSCRFSHGCPLEKAEERSIADGFFDNVLRTSTDTDVGNLNQETFSNEPPSSPSSTSRPSTSVSSVESSVRRSIDEQFCSNDIQKSEPTKPDEIVLCSTSPSSEVEDSGKEDNPPKVSPPPPPLLKPARTDFVLSFEPGTSASNDRSSLNKDEHKSNVSPEGGKSLSRVSHSRRFSCGSFFDRDLRKSVKDDAKETKSKSREENECGGKCGWDCLKLDVRQTLSKPKAALRGKSVRTIRPRETSIETKNPRAEVVVISIGISEKRSQPERGKEEKQAQVRKSMAGRKGHHESSKGKAAVVDNVKEEETDNDENHEIDKKAGEFIAKFKEQIRLQKVAASAESRRLK